MEDHISTPYFIDPFIKLNIGHWLTEIPECALFALFYMQLKHDLYTSYKGADAPETKIQVLIDMQAATVMVRSIMTTLHITEKDLSRCVKLVGSNYDKPVGQMYTIADLFHT